MSQKDNTVKGFQGKGCLVSNDFRDAEFFIEFIKNVTGNYVAPTHCVCACKGTITFKPTHKLIILPSPIPKPAKADKAFFERMHVTPFVNLNNLEPNEADPLLGWIDKTTGRNYRLKDRDGFWIGAPLIKDQVAEIKLWPVGMELFERVPVLSALWNGKDVKDEKVEGWRLDSRFALIRDTEDDGWPLVENKTWFLIHRDTGFAVTSGHWDDMAALWRDIKHCKSFDLLDPDEIVKQAEPEVIRAIHAYKYKRNPLSHWGALYSTVDSNRTLSRRWQKECYHYDSRGPYQRRGVSA